MKRQTLRSRFEAMMMNISFRNRLISLSTFTSQRLKRTSFLSRASFSLHNLPKTSSRCEQQSQAEAIDEKFEITDRLKGTEKSVWIEFGKLTTDNSALNLGRGFPDSFPPKFVTDSLKSVASCDANFHFHQYTRSYGHPRLVKALADTYSRELSRAIDPLSEVLVSVGAYGALYFANQGLVNPGDEVIILEPFFDSYQPMVTMARGVPRFVALKSTKPHGVPTSTADWTFDRKELEATFNNKTKLLIFNNPNNPLGKVYNEEEMHFIADLCKKHNVVVLADEVYERLVYPGHKFTKMASLPGMYERTITIGSVGKTFSVTGWKLGWSIGPPNLIKALCYVHQTCNYTCPTPLQEAVAMCFERENQLVGSEESYFHMLPLSLMPKKERMMEMLELVGIEPVIPEGGYFMAGDISRTRFRKDDNNPEAEDFQFTKWMCNEKKLSAIPVSAFYTDDHKHNATNLVRFCFFKQNETLDSAHEIFKNWKQQ